MARLACHATLHASCVMCRVACRVRLFVQPAVHVRKVHVPPRARAEGARDARARRRAPDLRDEAAHVVSDT